jgi:hypothetical protein
MSSLPFFELGMYLAATPRAGLTLMLIMYAARWTCYTRMRMHPRGNPVPIADCPTECGLARSIRRCREGRASGRGWKRKPGMGPVFPGTKVFPSVLVAFEAYL